jgi:phenylacetate-CoA ligase
MTRRISQAARESVFWLYHRLSGSGFRRHYQEINSQLSNRSIETNREHQQQKLSALLRHATDTVPFYKSRAGSTSIEDFPVMNKSKIREHFDSLVSKSYRPEQQIPMVTSGSTGTPFKVLQHKDKKIRNIADTLHFAERTGYRIGDRLYYMKIWSEYNKKSGRMKRLQNIVPIDVISFNETEVAQLVEALLKDPSRIAFLGYSSAFERICQCLEKAAANPVKVNISSAISMSETLNDYTKTTFEKYFGVPVYSRYSNIENGILAQQVPGSGSRYLINTASYWIEVLKNDEDRPANPGELGRIVVTDFYNRLMPLIRYDTGDVGALSDTKDELGNQCLDRIEGRKLDLLYATDGHLVSSYIVYKNMWQYTEINQYQLVQYGARDYLFKINMDGPFKRESQLIGEFKEFLGSDANLKVEYVAEIPLLASGKRKKISNTYHPSLSNP